MGDRSDRGGSVTVAVNSCAGCDSPKKEREVEGMMCRVVGIEEGYRGGKPMFCNNLPITVKIDNYNRHRHFHKHRSV